MKKILSLRQVNTLLLIIICLELGNAFLMFLPQFVRMILNEALFILLPALLLLKMERQPVRAYLQWRWPGWKLALLSLVVGAGLYPLSSASSSFYIQLLGYQDFIMPPDAVPSTVLTGILAIIAYAVMAPICEEVLFRGVIQRTYELHGFKNAFWFIGILFMLFHLSLLQGLSIIPLCIALGFVYARTRSLPASMLTHFGANGLAAIILTSRVFLTGAEKVILSQPAIYGGLALAVAALVWLWLATRKDLAEAEAQEMVAASAGAVPAAHEPAAQGAVAMSAKAPETSTAAPAYAHQPTVETASQSATPAAAPAPLPAAKPRRARLTFSQSWPLLGVLFVFLPLAGLEFFVSRWPEWISGPVQLNENSWGVPHTWNYEIRNIEDQPVREAECDLYPQVAPNEGEISLTCTSQHRAYEIHKGSSFYSNGDGEQQRIVFWWRKPFTLLGGEEIFNYKNGQSSNTWEMEEATFMVEHHPEDGPAVPFVHANDQISIMGKDVILPENLWPWMLASMKLEESENGRLIVFRPYTWIDDAEWSGPETELLYVKVAGKETVVTPAGEFETWKVTVGRQQTVWYSVEGKRVVKYFNGMETWLLK